LAASRQKGADTVEVALTDIVQAIYYGEGWRNYAKEIIVNVGVSKDEKKLKQIMNAIYKHGGMSRSSIMQSYHLSGRDMTAITDTLEQRGMIVRTKVGRGEMFQPALRAGE
jgi:predicted transcriptional regulator